MKEPPVVRLLRIIEVTFLFGVLFFHRIVIRIAVV